MNPKEIRIGNYIKFSDGIDDVRIGHFAYAAETGGYFSADPIPITEEWLIKFGFEKYFDWFSIDGIDFTFQWGFLQYVDVDGSITINKIEIEYVHQLQNIYFAITGEELKIKE